MMQKIEKRRINLLAFMQHEKSAATIMNELFCSDAPRKGVRGMDDRLDEYLKANTEI